MDFEAASKIAVTEEDRVSDTWLRFDAGLEPPRIPGSVLEGTVPRSLPIWYLHASGSIAAR